MPQNPVKILSAKEFHIRLAGWMLENARCVPRNEILRQDYIDSYIPPEFDWGLSQSYIGADGKIYMHFRARLCLLSCQTRDGKAPRALTVWQIRSRAAAQGSRESVLGFGIG